jgi:hypothetical protein
MEKHTCVRWLEWRWSAMGRVESRCVLGVPGERGQGRLLRPGKRAWGTKRSCGDVQADEGAAFERGGCVERHACVRWLERRWSASGRVASRGGEGGR